MGEPVREVHVQPVRDVPRHCRDEDLVEVTVAPLERFRDAMRDDLYA
jgi:hypothetical protein